MFVGVLEGVRRRVLSSRRGLDVQVRVPRSFGACLLDVGVDRLGPGHVRPRRIAGAWDIADADLDTAGTTAEACVVLANVEGSGQGPAVGEGPSLGVSRFIVPGIERGSEFDIRSRFKRSHELVCGHFALGALSGAAPGLGGRLLRMGVGDIDRHCLRTCGKGDHDQQCCGQLNCADSLQSQHDVVSC